MVCSAASIPTIGDSQNGWSNNEELPIDPMAVKGDTYRNMCVYIYGIYIYGFSMDFTMYIWDIHMDIHGYTWDIWWYNGITSHENAR